MKKLLTIILTAALCLATLLSFGGCAQEEVVGVDIYLMELVAEKLNMKIQVNDVDFDTICGKVAAEDNAIGAAGITINDERALTVAFSNPYFSSVQCIISASSQAYDSLEDLAGLKIGVQKGTTGALMVADAIASGVLAGTGAEIVEYDNGAIAYTALKSSGNQCDVIVLDKLPAEKHVSADPTAYVATPIAGVATEEYGLAVGKNASMKDAIIAAMNQVIAEVDMEDVVAYWTAISNGETPTVELVFADLSDNTAGTLQVYTCSGFEPYEFVITK